jgi:hypothetical protein
VQLVFYHPEDFLSPFSSRNDVDRVLHAPDLLGAGLVLVFQRWWLQINTLFSPLRYKVPLSITNTPAQAWSVDSMQALLGSSCLIFETSLHSLDRSDMSSFLLVTWSMHPKLIPTEVGYAISELVEPFVECAPPLFLRASKIIHSKCDTLQFQVFIRILEIHDFNIPSNSESDSSSEGDSSGEDYPDYNTGRGMLQPWPQVYHIATGSAPTGDLWPSLPMVGGCLLAHGDGERHQHWSCQVLSHAGPGMHARGQLLFVRYGPIGFLGTV